MCLAILRLARADSCLLAFLAVFLPLVVGTKDLSLSIARASPLLFISMCAFIANDLNDVEKDRINHPDRPLPAGHLTTAFAVVMYFACLALALFTTQHFVAPEAAFLYYVLLVLSISYGHIADDLPALKAPYVAFAISLGILIAATGSADAQRLRLVAGPSFLVALGRELCMDVKDRAGDPYSIVHSVGSPQVVSIAFLLQAIGLLLLALLVHDFVDVWALIMMIVVFALSVISWYRFAKYRIAIALMKGQFLLGLCFLA